LLLQEKAKSRVQIGVKITSLQPLPISLTEEIAALQAMC